MKFLRAIKQNIPNAITCLNLLSGSLACVFSFRFAEQPFGGLHGYELAFVLMGMSVVFDFCDGLSARLLHAYSALGKELDSLSDLVSFGMAPAMLTFSMMRHFSADTPWAYLSFLIVVFGAIRLAKFNIDDRQTSSFIGLPIPANAIFWIGMIAWNMQYHYVGDFRMSLFLVVFPLLMVSRFRMFSLKVKNFALRDNVRRYALLIGAVSFVAYAQLAGLVWTILFYIVLSLTAKRNEQM